jgi:hypothetical protein
MEVAGGFAGYDQDLFLSRGQRAIISAFGPLFPGMIPKVFMDYEKKKAWRGRS